MLCSVSHDQRQDKGNPHSTDSQNVHHCEIVFELDTEATAALIYAWLKETLTSHNNACSVIQVFYTS